eukprot:g14519.t1
MSWALFTLPLVFGVRANEIFGAVASDYHAGMHEGANSCYMSASERCSIATFPGGQSTLVYPGGATRCLKHDSSPFAFQVVPRDRSKLLLFFQAGGACWDAATTWAGTCLTSISPQRISSGIFSDSNPANPYKDYTLVIILYCSGDVHAGNVTRKYGDVPGSDQPAVQVGAENVLATLKWISAQNLGTLRDLVVAGSSAGAIGLQAWGAYVLPYFRYDHAAVIVDSFVGVIDCMGPLISRMGACTSVLLEAYPDFLAQKCRAESVDLYDLVPIGLLKDPRVIWTFLQSKYDATQISYYAATAALCLEAEAPIKPDWFYAWSSMILQTYRFYPNFQLFLVDAAQHTYLEGNEMYKATTSSSRGGDNQSPTMLAFLQQQRDSANSTVTSQCEGPLLSRTDWSGVQFCDSVLFPNMSTAGIDAVSQELNLLPPKYLFEELKVQKETPHLPQL